MAAASRQTPADSPARSDWSRSVAIARIVCIVLMTTTHIWPGANRVITAADTWAEFAFYRIVVDNFGRASVPLLSLFSGLLFVGTFARAETVAGLVADKFRSLIVPMILWSLPFLVLVMVKAWITGVPHVWPQDAMGWANDLFALRGTPANSPLHFLREIFVMCLLGAGLLLIWGYSPVTATLVAGAVLFLMHQPGGFLILRPYIATAFLIGMAMALAGRYDWSPPWRLVLPLLGGYLVVYWLWPESIRDIGTQMSRGYPTRLVMGLLVWRICRDLAEMPRSTLRDAILSLEPHIFIIFCTHAITIFFVGGLAFFLGWSEHTSYYIVIFLLQIPLCIAVGVVVSRMLWRYPVFSGGPRRRGVMAGRA